MNLEMQVVEEGTYGVCLLCDTLLRIVPENHDSLKGWIT
jgi:hypothetical protein